MKTSQKEQTKTQDGAREESKHEIENMPQKSFVPWEKTVSPGSFRVKRAHGFPWLRCYSELARESAAVVCILAETLVEEEEGGIEGKTAAGGI